MKHSFSVSPRILSHLGEELIKSESIALFELVKNSYDACSTYCMVDFHFTGETLKKITIEDDGIGMDKTIVEHTWLVIGTDNKKLREVNSCGRIPLGEKGIGRLGVHKLGNKITLISKKESEKEVEINIDWTRLEEAKKVDDFIIDVSENDIPKVFSKSTGTKIIIENLKSNWDKLKLKDIYRNINTLNSPFPDSEDAFFRVLISSNNDAFDKLPDFDEIRKYALYTGYCKMEGREITEFNYDFKPWKSLDKIEGRHIEIKDLSDEDKKIKKIISKKEFEEIDLDESKIGTIEFNILIFDFDAQIFSFANTERDWLYDYLKENGGVRVYRDGVRVYNYGERDNDWLGIDIKRVKRVGGNVSNNILIGSVKIRRSESTGLTEKTNREGFIENEYYYDFEGAINYALSLVVRQRNIDKSILTELYKRHKIIEPVLSELNEVIQLVENNLDNEIKNDILKYLYRINDQYKEVKEVLIKSANAGLNLSVVIHEIEKLIAELTGCINRNEKDKAINISLLLEKIIRGYSAMIKKSSIKLTSLSKVVKTALENYEFRFLDHNINVVFNYKDSKLQAFLSEPESISVLINLLDNAIYWLSYARKTERLISVYITDQIEGYYSIVVSDNGPGFNIPTSVATQPFITGKPHNIGSGLGLHIANEMMKAMNGKLMFLNNENINLPEIVREKKITNAIISLCFPIEKIKS